MRPLLAAALAVFSVGVFSSTADAATVRANVSIQGSGSVTAPGYSGCSNPDQRNWIVKTCENQHVVTNDPSIFGVSTTLTASTGGQWKFVKWTGCESTSGAQCTVGAGAFSGNDWWPRAYFVDDVKPSPIYGPSETYSVTHERAVSFAFGYNEAVTTECRVGANAFQACSTGIGYTLPEGDHVFEVRAWDASGNFTPPIARSFKIVDTEITAGPPPLTNSRSATLNFSSIAGNAFECRLDGAPYTACPGLSKSYSGLPDGVHDFDVRAVNGQYSDRIPERWTWRVDGTPPAASLMPHPATPGEGVISALTTATFVLDADEPVSFQCSLDGAAFGPCGSPKSYTGLKSGKHTFKVRGVDRAGNVGAPTERTWSVAVPDADSDGYNALADCNDNDATVNPGRAEIVNNNVDENCDGKKEYDRDLDGSRADRDCDDHDPRRTPGKPEIPGNAVDEDCDGIAQKATMLVGLGSNWDIYSKYTVLKGLTVAGTPVGAKVVAVCHGKSCPKKKVTKIAKKPRVKLKKFSGKKLKPGTRLVVTVTHPSYDTAVKTLKIRKGKRPLISVG